MTATNHIAALNDLFRSTGRGGKVVATRGIATLPKTDQIEVIARVRLFDNFTEDDDPYGEHDFGAFDVNGNRVFWKIDYYNETMDGGSEDPADPKKTTRVLTIMLASEY